MRRALAAGLLAVVVAVVVVVLVAAGGGGGGSYRVDAVFDTARGMVPGQLVKIAGARVGHVTGVHLAPGPAARLELEVPERYAPFRADASCRILPEGFISENYVECDPGRSRAPLRDGPSGVPTVARSRTAVPVTLQQVIDIFAAPTSQRLRIVLGELGIGTAGRGDDLNAALRRANPALTQARAVLAELGAQNGRLADAVAQTDAVVARLAGSREGVRRFVSQAAGALRAAGSRRTELSQAVAGFPATLRATDAALGRLDRVARDGTPVAQQARAAAPQLTALTRSLPAFAQAGLPAVRHLRATAASGRKVLPAATKVTGQLRAFTRAATPVTHQLDDLLVSLRDRGGIEALMQLGYALSTQSSGFDAVSHMAGVFIGLAPECLAGSAAGRPPGPGCSHAFTAPGKGTVPVNAPSAGPQDHFDTVMSDARLPGSVRTTTSQRLPRTSIRSLLDYLLK